MPVPNDADTPSIVSSATWTSAYGPSAPVAVEGWMDCRWNERNGRPFVDFTWEGSDEGDQISGSGWAGLAENGTLTGRLFIHMGDESGFTATPSTRGKKHNEA